MPSNPAPARRYSSRPFYATIFIFTLLATYSIFATSPSKPQQDDGASLSKRSGEDCRLVHHAQDKCAFVKRNCRDDEAGLLEYLTLYYCSLGKAQPVAFVVLVLWLGLLFTTIGIAASDFFSVNLSTIATILGLSESLAGVTFLAFGNGSPDVFSTFAAMGSNSGSMAVGELIGAAGFITSVVAGSMALVREFKVGRKTFVRDICFYIAAVAFAVAFLADGKIHLWECCVMIGFYLFYVVVVVGWHAYTRRKQARRAKEVASRNHYYAPGGGHGNDELEPYRDDLDDDGSADRRVSMSGGPASVDIGVLERGPRVEVAAAEPDKDDDEDAMRRGQQVAAEMTSNMRVSRPRGRRSNTTIMPIRPSLVGALEFRSVLSSLQQEGNMRMRPIVVRSRSEDGITRRRDGKDAAATRGMASARTVQGAGDAPTSTRSRALSSGAATPVADADLSPRDATVEQGRVPNPHMIDGKLAPPPLEQSVASTPTEGSIYEESLPPTSPQLHRLRIPSPHDSERSPLDTFGASDAEYRTSLTFSLYGPPHITEACPLVAIPDIAPTPCRVRLISAPSIFLLVITLPVVESERADDDSTGDFSEQPASGHLGDTTAPVSFEPHGSMEPETEWQRYRRSTRSITSAPSSPPLISIVAPYDNPESGTDPETLPLPSMETRSPEPVSDIGRDGFTIPDEEPGWNRWLFLIQIFTGPLFCTFIIWANMAEELGQPIRTLIRLLLSSLVGSLVLLGVILMTTSPDRRPKYHFLFCFLGFCISIAWISSVAGEVVGVLKAFGVILDISEAILGLTVFAVGNSVGDLVADVTVARLGYPVMALSACFGGPLLNILLGIGLGGAWQTIQAAKKRKAKHPDRPFQYKPYHIQVNGTLIVSTIALLVTLLALLIMVPMNKWVMNRKIGWFLIALWTISTTTNLVLEVTGVGRDIA
ncbi:hypothetical protein DL765_000297 [Monosporascus sp. GIB2]|nr:hypothetical protein DL765_000297 [Monosporascus sp. GIB2]